MHRSLEEQVIEIHQSTLTKYLRCKRQWMFDEVWNLRPSYSPDEPKPQRMPNNADVGTLAHAGLEAYYTGGNPLPAIQEKLVELAEPADDAPLPAEWVKADRTARSMVEGYIEWVGREGLDDHYTTVGVEERLELPGVTTFGEPVLFVGTLDLRVMDEITEEYGIGDHKSVQTLSQVPRPGDFQVRHYAWMLDKLGQPVPRFGFHNLLRRVDRSHRASKPPYFDRVFVNINEEMVAYHDKLLTSLVDQYVLDYVALQADPEQHVTLAPPSMTTECSWRCNNVSLCDQMFDGDWQSVILEGFNHAKEVRFA
jgi:hypothetical protein